MRICLLTREYPPETGWGGIATFSRHLAHGLKDIGHDVSVITLANTTEQHLIDQEVDIYRIPPYEFAGGIDLLNMCMPFSHTTFRNTTALWSKFLELHQQMPFDVVDAPELLADGIYVAVTRIAPLVIRLYTPHSKFISEQLHHIRSTFDHELIAMLERTAMRRADVITSPSEDLANWVANDLSYDRTKIAIVHNPIDPNEFTPDGAKALLQNDKLTVLFVGRLEERKGIHYLVESIPEVVRQFPSVRFIILGDDTQTASNTNTNSVLAQLKASLASTGSTEHVDFIDRVPLTQLAQYYRCADICVVPSVYDNSPYTCLEAMSCGKAVIGTTGGGTREYLVDGESGLLVPPRNTDKLTEAILRLLKNTDERLRLGQNARKRVLTCFHRENIASSTIVLYEQAIKHFAEDREPRLYLKDPTEAIHDVEHFLYSYHRTIGDFLFLHSWSFRLKYWLELRKRPKLLLAKLFVILSRLIRKLTAGKFTSPKLAKLEEEIELKQDPLRNKYRTHPIAMQTTQETVHG